MSDDRQSNIHRSFWVIGTIALIWNGLGVANYLVQMSMDSFDAYREAERVIIEGRPAWATAAFAIAVFGGTLGSAFLMLKKPAAVYLFIASLAGSMVVMIHAFGAAVDFGPGEIIGIILMPLAVGAFLIWYSKYAVNRGWIR